MLGTRSILPAAATLEMNSEVLPQRRILNVEVNFGMGCSIEFAEFGEATANLSDLLAVDR